MRIHACPPWLQDLADQAAEALRDAAGGWWPVTRDQCHRAARALELQLRIAPDVHTACIGALCLVRDTHDDLTTLPRVVHELVEAAAARDGLGAVYRDARVPHQVACLVQEEYTHALRVVLAIEDAAERRRRQARTAWSAPLPDLTYERDEHADAPRVERRRRRSPHS